MLERRSGSHRAHFPDGFSWPYRPQAMPGGRSADPSFRGLTVSLPQTSFRGLEEIIWRY